MKRTFFTCTIDDCVAPHDARGMCTRHYNCWKRTGDPRGFSKYSNPTGVCTAPGCEKRARTPGSRWCEMHYMRMYSHGCLEGAARSAKSGVHEKSNGYLEEMNQLHPMAVRGKIYVHRRVFYDNNGPGPYRCHWCSKWVKWKKLKVDHRDGVVKNNDPSNLLPSCHTCNVFRVDQSQVTVGRHRSPTIRFEGQEKTVAQWAASIGIKVCHLHRRIVLWPLERALKEPGRKHALRKPKQLGMLDDLFKAGAASVSLEARRLSRASLFENRMKS